MSKKIYLLTTGDYSDYRIHGAFSSRKKAQKFADTFPDFADRSTGWDIECYELDEYESWIDLYKDSLAFEIELYENGDVADIEVGDSLLDFEWAIEAYGKIHTRDGRPILRTWVIAKDRKHAIKIANERRAQLIASGEWERASKSL